MERRRKPEDERDDPNPATAALCRCLRALASPVRLDLLSLLADGGHDVGALAAALRISQPAASRNLAVLRHAGLVDNSREATRRIQVLSANIQIRRGASRTEIRVTGRESYLVVAVASRTFAESELLREAAAGTDAGVVQVRPSAVAALVAERKSGRSKGLRHRG